MIELKQTRIKKDGSQALYSAYAESISLQTVWLNNVYFTRKQLANRGLVCFYFYCFFYLY
jgi:hypothetical protein